MRAKGPVNVALFVCTESILESELGSPQFRQLGHLGIFKKWKFSLFCQRHALSTSFRICVVERPTFCENSNSLSACQNHAKWNKLNFHLSQSQFLGSSGQNESPWRRRCRCQTDLASAPRKWPRGLTLMCALVDMHKVIDGSTSGCLCAVGQRSVLAFEHQRSCSRPNVHARFKIIDVLAL